MSSLIQASRNMLHLSLTRRGGIASTFVRSLYKQYSLIQMYFLKFIIWNLYNTLHQSKQKFWIFYFFTSLKF
jgi:hypothetical protein